VKRLVCLLIVLGITATAQAQTCPAAPSGTVVSPTQLCFVASPDHDALDLGTPVVSGYTLGYCVKGSDAATCTPVQSQSLGKPSYAGPNKIIVVNKSSLPTLFATPIGQEYITVLTVNGEDAGLFARYPAGNPFGQPSHQAPRPAAVPPVATP